MDFNIRPISRVCAATGESLVAGSTCWSVLVEEEGRMVRHDYSLEGWTGPPGAAVGYWQCEVPAESGSGPRLIDPDSLFDYFVQLCESPNTVEQDYQYVLVLLLLRKRRLILDQTVEIDDRPVMRLNGSGGEGPFDVEERELTEQQILQLQDQLFGGTPEAAA